MPAGRPSLYRDEYCDEIVAYCATGRSLTAFAGKIGVSRQSISEWAKEHPQFSVAVQCAKAACAAWWEERACKVADEGGPGGQATMVIFGLKNHAPDDFRERQEIQHSGELKVERLDDVQLNERIVTALVASGLSEAQARAFVEREDKPEV